MVDTYPSALEHLRQSTFLWGCVGAFLAIILTVIAAMSHDIRWLLGFAWPFMTFAVWEFARTGLSNKKMIAGITVGGAILSIGALGWLYTSLAPSHEVKSIMPAIASNECNSISPSAPNWLQIATKECGQKELRWPQENKRINEYFSSLKDGKHHRQDIEDDPLSDWASAFVEWSLNQVGKSGPKSIYPFAWRTWGRKIEKPEIGCIVVLSLNGIPHVGFYMGDDGDRIKVLGGNEDDMVEIARYQKSAAIDYRMPSDSPASVAWVTRDEIEIAGRQGRILVGVKPEDLMISFYTLGSKAVEPYLGKWIKISHEFSYVSKVKSNSSRYLSLVLYSTWKLNAQFDLDKYESKLLTYVRHQHINALCKIGFVGQPEKFDVQFVGKDCELN